ncbi:BRO-N domain-containing protein [Halodesulfovibrio aestuarii]|uniref:BRO family, N-terminal domain n=1 Tax=Halodesulfovibrio aestuarii TaxID=126333 RepID=A0A8G2FA94_9BACT|nr:Bro-N domain-containing protein [Halodesulfovibrio aestuarii]SHJ75072.1 BRO family, N-terminal domain [Halodesulfovibrio aestuarii]
MTNIVPFDFGMNTVRTMLRDGDIWFVGKDVCEVLGYSNHRKAIADHCKSATKDGVTIRDSIGREQQPTIIPERDLYRLIFRSRLPEAERFEDWVVSVVLPALRKNGSYTVDTPPTTSTQPETPELPEAALNLKPNVRAQVLNCALQAAKMDGNTPEQIDYYFAKYAAMVGTKPARIPLPTELTKQSPLYEIVKEWINDEGLKPARNMSRKFRVRSMDLYSRFQMWCFNHEIHDVPTQAAWGRQTKKLLPSNKIQFYYYYVEQAEA